MKKRVVQEVPVLIFGLKPETWQYLNLLVSFLLHNIPQQVTDLTRYKPRTAYRKFLRGFGIQNIPFES
jgi:hypothetical protein